MEEEKVLSVTKKKKYFLGIWAIAAMIKLAVMYYNGDGVAKSNKKAISLFSVAAKKGDNKSAIRLADIYNKEKKYKKAFALYKQVADAGYPIAQHKVGVMYKKGLGTNKDIKKATKYLASSALQSCAEAQYTLGKMYLEGDGIKKNKNKAKDLISEAYLNGKPEAKIILDKQKWHVTPKTITMPKE